jgi:hypothetical protein
MALETEAGDSTEQRKAETVMLELLGEELGIRFSKHRHKTERGATTEIDGVCSDPPTLVEAWAHQGAPKAAQKHKVMADAAKLTWAAAAFYPHGARKILLFSDPVAAAPWQPSSRSWMAVALVHFGIEVRVVELPALVRDAVVAAQLRQFR